ncbi:MAG TPA: hypothetical protein VGF33_08320 [Caulobacteraceae bacterium]|jgi:hypothetical protein
MNFVLFFVVMLLFTVLGVAFTFRARTVRDWLMRLYKNQAITNHFTMPGFVFGMRVVGFGWVVLGSIALAAVIRSQISN